MNTLLVIKKKIELDEMLEWFSTVLCWKHMGVVDSSTVTQAYLWLTSTLGEFAASAKCTGIAMV